MGDVFTLTLPLLLCLVPLAMVVTAWQLHRRLTPPLPPRRAARFQCGLLSGILCTPITMSLWIDSFPLIRVGNDYSDKLLDWAFYAAIVAGLLSAALAFSGRGWPRILLVGSGLLSFLLICGGFIQNGV
jgi:hypothetical protein